MKNYEKIFSKNLKNLRKTFHISQKQLADDLGYSEKTISKWEAAAGLPNIATAYEIAKIFRVSIDDLFNHEHQICFLGIDGGGTKTELVLTDSNQKVIRTLLVEGCNPMDIGMEETKRILREAIWKVCEDIPYASISMFAGIAGGTTGHMKSELNRFFKDFKFYSYANDSDNLNIISAGLGKKDGIILILGTGVCAYTQVKGEHIRTAGWGYLIDNGGSAYNIGRDGLNAYYCEKDKTGAKTLLTDIIESSYLLVFRENHLQELDMVCEKQKVGIWFSLIVSLMVNTDIFRQRKLMISVDTNPEARSSKQALQNI